MREIEKIYFDAVRSVDPENAIAASVRISGNILQAGPYCFDLAGFERILVVGAGKAASKMAKAMEKILNGRISGGLVVTKYGHSEKSGFIEVAEASHPVPDVAGVMATERILDLAKNADEKTLIICLLSGGASALLVSPAGELTLEDKQAATSLLLHAGADIADMNCVRKHLSRVKGGNLARAAHPAKLLSLVISDVIGDRLDVIASGPTFHDDSTYADALEVIEKFGIIMPKRVMDHLKSGAQGLIPETVKECDPCLENSSIHILANLEVALDSAEKCAAELGFFVERGRDAICG
ncbi:MAG: glycerate-2-kinase family protein, partial [Burkholderiales bacterium]|nr:glycerate-2-kinase family protein [Burkholderiales bacterium]